MIQVLRHYGYTCIFLVVFFENLGVPIPAFPFVLVGTALAADLHFRLSGIVTLSVLAAITADEIWYVLGRLRGHPILRKLCSLSLRPDSCVSRTENLFDRNGMKLLLVAKFVPGLNTVAPPLAGMLRISPLRFSIFDLGGIGAWVATAVLLGLGFRAQVEWLIYLLSALGRTSVVILLVALAGWLLLKWMERRRFYRSLARARISPSTLQERLARGDDLVVVDLRSDLNYQTSGVKIPGAIRIPPQEFHERHKEISSGRPVVMYCT
jgi:membrane protein DedA with SNARE-associated domain